MTVPALIALTGHAGSGKSTAAEMIHDLYGHEIVHFADPLRAIAYASMPRIRRLVDAYGWTQAKKMSGEIRPALQTLGDSIRTEFGERVLIDKALDHPHIVIGDVRTIKEAEAIIAHGGKVIEITRKGAGPANGHWLEHQGLRGYISATVSNDGTLAALPHKLEALLGSPTHKEQA